MVNALLSALIGTWGCSPRAGHELRSFTLTVTPMSDTAVQIQGMNTFPGNGRNQWHTLTADSGGEYAIDQGLVTYPFRGRIGEDGTIVFARPNQDRLFFQLMPDRQSLRFVFYKTTGLEIYREEHMVVCQRG